MFIVIFFILALMSGVGYFTPTQTPSGGYRYSFGLLGLICLVIAILLALHIINPTA
jgi:hypothetical protein